MKTPFRHYFRFWIRR